MEEHFLGETLVSIGQRTAIEAVAWALLKLFLRGKALGLAEGNAMPLPYRQHDLADALGLSLVHTNKTLARLRQRQLADWSEGQLRVHNLDDLAQLARSDCSLPQKRPIL